MSGPTLLENHSNEDQMRIERLRFQIWTDTLAYSQNVPLRLLVKDELKQLPKVLLRLLQQSPMQELLSQNLQVAAIKLREELEQLTESKIHDALQWSLRIFISIAQSSTNTERARKQAPTVDRNSYDVPDGISEPIIKKNWWRLLTLALPHIERKIWLTENSAPLPIHALCRMSDVWSLYVLLWCWSEISKISSSLKPIPAFAEGLVSVVLLSKFSTGARGDIYPVVGPVFLNDNSEDIIASRSQEYGQLFREFVQTVSLRSKSLKTCAEDLPPIHEISAALDARRPISKLELRLRCKTIRSFFAVLNPLRAEIEASNPTLNRDGIEVLGIVVAWWARWHRTFRHAHRKEIAGNPDPISESACFTYRLPASNWAVRICYGQKISNIYSIAVVEATERKDESSDFQKWVENQKDLPGFTHVDTPDVMLNRMYERQNSAWAAQVTAINNLLQRQSGLSRPNSDDLWAEPSTKDPAIDAQLGEHSDVLLNMGNDVARHLLSIARADVANIYTVDYDSDPPRLRHVAGYARQLDLRASSRTIWSEFSRHAYKPSDPNSPCQMRENSTSHAYRTLATNSDNVLASAEEAIWDGYPKHLKAKSGMALPLRYHGRVVGILELAGLVNGQFTYRQLRPLRRAADLLGPFIYHNIFLEQIRMLNVEVAQRAPIEWTERDNPLGVFAEVLSNVFLCPVANIWLCADDVTFFQLQGHNNESVFGPSDPGRKPWSFVSQEGQANIPDHERPFADLALRIGGVADKARGQLVKGRVFLENSSPTTFSQDEERDSIQSLNRDFVSNLTKDRSYRKSLLERFKDIAAFSLFGLGAYVGKTNRNYHSNEKNLEKNAESGSRKIVGIVTLHDFGDHDDHAFSQSWAPIVRYIQDFLPILLQQTETINSELVNARRLLIHEATSEIRHARDRMTKLSGQIQYFLVGKGRETLRRLVQTDREPRIRDELKPLLDAAIAAEENMKYLTNGEIQRRLTRMAGKLSSAKAYSSLTIDPGEGSKRMRLSQTIADAIREHPSRLSLVHRVDGVYVELKMPQNIDIRVIASAWRHLISNIIDNMAKYRIRNSACAIELDGHKLTLRNEGYFNSEHDLPSKHQTFGVRGAWAKQSDATSGDGVGLYVAKLAAELASVEWKYEIAPSAKLLDGWQIADFVVTLDLSTIIEWRRS